MNNYGLKKILDTEKIDTSEIEKLLNTHVLITITDLDGIILYANSKFLELMGYDEGEVIGNNHRIFQSGSHSVTFYKKLWSTVLSKKKWSGIILNKTKNGQKIWLKTTIIPIIKNDTITHLAAIRHDISEHVKNIEMLSVAKKTVVYHNLSLESKLEENKQQMKLQKLSVIGELASRMSHDMRNPLSVIKTSIENIVLIYGEHPNAAPSFQRMCRAINRITHQIDDVLDFVREKEIIKDHINLSETIPEILATFTLPQEIDLQTSIQEIKIEFNKTMFFAVIKNLILNSIQACENKGEIKIQTIENDSSILIEVTDSGPGIPQESINKIFEPLFTTKQHGTGLGLASCKNIIESHGGTIDVKNNPTIFSIELPKE